jgi:peptidoglycan/LPS O-acetylase OafA/YrhL
MCALGKNIVIYFPIWLFGTAVCLLPQMPFLRRTHPVAATLLALAFLCCIVAGTHSEGFKNLVNHSVVVTDFVIALSFAVVLYVMLHNQSPGGRGAYPHLARFLAGCSYTLYVVHMPLLVFLRATLVEDVPWSPDPIHILIATVIAIGCVLFAHVVARFTEARTDYVREKVLSALALDSSATLRPATEERK